MIVKGTKQLGSLSSRKKDVNVYVSKVKKPQIISSLGAQTHEVCYGAYPFSYYIIATNNPISYNATNLPEGITINTSNGHIYGQSTYDNPNPQLGPPPPTVITIYASNRAGTASATFTLEKICTSQPDPGGGGGGGGGDDLPPGNGE